MIVNKRKLFLAALSFAVCALFVFLLLSASACAAETEIVPIGNYEINGTEDGASDGAEEGEGVSGLVIPIADFSETPKFYGVTVNGTYMQVIALLYKGSYRTAFNTCQVCYGSPEAYFKQKGNYLQCQNCNNLFALSAVGVASGSCNPYPILASYRVMTDDAVIIPDSYLIKSKALFKNWGGDQV